MVYMYHSFLIHSSAGGHLGCFHVLAIINSCTPLWSIPWFKRWLPEGGSEAFWLSPPCCLPFCRWWPRWRDSRRAWCTPSSLSRGLVPSLPWTRTYCSWKLPLRPPSAALGSAWACSSRACTTPASPATGRGPRVRPPWLRTQVCECAVAAVHTCMSVRSDHLPLNLPI